MVLKRCKHCGAMWRKNYPFGRKSKALTHWIKPHEKDCPVMRREPIRKRKESFAKKKTKKYIVFN